MPRTAPLTDFAQVVPGATYGTADVASLLRVTEDTVLLWIKSGKIATLPRIRRRSPHRILGATVLSLLGERAAALPQPVESATERRRRAAADLEAIRGLAKGRMASTQ